MIFYLVTSAHFYTTDAYFRSWGKPYASQVKVLFYENLATTKQLPCGTYIFSDIERLDPAEAELAAQIWQDLANAPYQLRLLNHPTRSMRRYELLRTLHQQGFNKFNIYALTELQTPQSFPVFIRGENDHGGNLTPLLHTPEELEAAIHDLDQQGKSKNDKVIVEYCDTSSQDGTFRKYSAFIVGDQIIPTHMFFSGDWVTKVEKVEEMNNAMLQEEREFVEGNPHEKQLRQIAQIARINYGRIDYGVLNGEIQIWEINTNPMMPRLSFGGASREPVLRYSTQRLNSALAAINCQLSPEIQIKVSTNPQRLKQLGKSLLHFVPPQYTLFVRRRLRRETQTET